MDFELTDSQVLLRDELRKALASWCSPDEIRRMLADREVVDRGLWQRLGDLGVFGLHLATEKGGVGLGMTESTIVFEELGRVMVPGPLIATFLAAGLVDGAATGEVVVGATESRSPFFVEHAGVLDALIVVGSDGLHEVDPMELNWERVERPLDPLTPVCSSALPLPAGRLIGDEEDARQWLRRGGLLVAAFQVGLAAGALDLATQYAKDRVQFGRTIGSFQAIKHLLADVLAATEVARVAVNATGVEIDERAPEATITRAVCSARILASKAARTGAETCVQVHGGMGYTWEGLSHLFLKRSMVLDTQFGSNDEALEGLAASLVANAGGPSGR